MTRPARVVVDLAALRHNLARVRERAPRSKVMAIVKADAYGHGIARVAGALAEADGFGVACLEEACQLREAGVQKKILLLEGPYAAGEVPTIQALGLDVVIHHRAQFDLLDAAAATPPLLKVWLKLDTGMHRLGFAPEDLDAAWTRLRQHPAVAEPPRLLSHLACANEPDNPMTAAQARLFAAATRAYPVEKSLANSAGLLASEQCQLDWVRPGLMLYGVSPIDGRGAADFGLRPAMSLESRLISLRNLQQGEPVGYGASWLCPEAMPVGIVAAGYGDGFPRHADTGTPVLVAGKRCSVIGKPSMDMLTVDLRSRPDAKIGDPALLWGGPLPIELIARHADTTPYELLCGVHKRLQFVEVEGEGQSAGREHLSQNHREQQNHYDDFVVDKRGHRHG